MRIRLSDADRERLGCPEWLEVDLDNLSNEEAEQIELAGGEYENYFRSGPFGMSTRIWVALRRVGCAPAKVAELRFNLAQLDMEPSPGKAPSTKSAKPTATRSGATRAGRSTRTNKAAS